MTNIKFLILSLLMTLVSCQVESEMDPNTVVISSKEIIDNDDRYQIKSLKFKNEKNYQYTVGLISLNRGDKKTRCTGTLIGEYHIITAAHCVYKNGKVIDSAYFDPAILGVEKTKKWRFFIEKVWVNKKFIANHDYDLATSRFDIAILQIKKYNGQPVPGIQYGYLGRKLNNIVREDLDLKLIGYSGDKIKATLWESECSIFKVRPSKDNHHYDCDSFSGTSGGPVLHLDDEGSVMGILGVHVGAVGDPVYTNKFVSFNKRIFDDIEKIIKGDNSLIENFKQFTISLEPAISVFFHNKCHKPIYLGLRYKNLESEWVTKGYFMLEPGEAGNFINTKNIHYYYYAQDYSADKVWSGDKEVIIMEKRKNFKKSVTDSYWHNKTHRFTCKN